MARCLHSNYEKDAAKQPSKHQPHPPPIHPSTQPTPTNDRAANGDAPFLSRAARSRFIGRPEWRGGEGRRTGGPAAALYRPWALGTAAPRLHPALAYLDKPTGSTHTSALVLVATGPRLASLAFWFCPDRTLISLIARGLLLCKQPCLLSLPFFFSEGSLFLSLVRCSRTEINLEPTSISAPHV